MDDQVIPGRLATGRVRPIGGQADLEQTKLLPIRMETVGLGIDRHTIDWVKLREQLRQLRRTCNHFNPLKSNSALVLVASRFSINFSIASIGGSAAIVLRNNCTRSHSSG